MKKINTITSLGLVIAMFAVLMGPFAQIAYAAVITAASDTMSTQKELVASSHTIKFTTPTGAEQSTDTIIVTFPSTGTTPFNFTSKTIASITLTHGATTGLETTEVLAATPGVSDWGAVLSGTQNRILTLTAPTDGVGVATLAATQKIVIAYTSANSINPSVNATPYTIAISGTFGDTGNISVPILTNDQVAVTATVDNSLTFSISDPTIGFGTLVTANARFANGAETGANGPTSVSAHTLAIATNAATGYNITYNGATLTSGANTIPVATITSDEDGVPGSAQFAIGFTRSGDATIATAYNQVTPTFNYSFVAGVATQIVSETVPTATETISAFYLANISGTSAAGSYTTTLTYVATANF